MTLTDPEPVASQRYRVYKSIMTLTDKQKAAVKSIVTWYADSNHSPYLTLGGYAGTGKTTLVTYLRKFIHDQNPKLRVAFCSYTGKAARLLQQKLRENGGLYKGDAVSTIHRMIYSPILNDKDEVIGWERREAEKFPYSLIIVDEASMVDQFIWRDLTSYGIPILAVGDHGQLPPIEGKFNLMDKPDIRLEEIFRQQQGSPIIELSIKAREEGEIPFGKFGPGVMKLNREDPDTWERLQDMFTGFNDEAMVLVGYNFSRNKLNESIRNLLELHSPDPLPGDRVICLKNNHKRQVFNGMTGVINSIVKEGELYKADISVDGEEQPYSGLLLAEQFGAKSTLDTNKPEVDLFDFGYALTVHKAQGSQAKRVVVFEERFKQMDDEMWRRWLYTAVTRASEELYLVA